MYYQNNINMLNPYLTQQYPVSYGASQIDPYQIGTYATVAANEVKDDSKVTDGLGAMTIFGTASAMNTLRKYARNSNQTFTSVLKEQAQISKNSLQTLRQAATSADSAATISALKSSNKLTLDIIELQASIPKASKLAKMPEVTKTAYESANSLLIKASKATTQASKEALLKEAKGLISQATGTGAKEAAKTVAEETAKATVTSTAKAGSKVAKFVKGNAALIAIEGGLELATTVVPTFKQLGTEKGLKQLGKSSVKVAASVGGFAAGSAAGAAIGSCICPVAGTIIGAVLGGVGSWVAGKLAKKVVGKDELEIAAEKQQKEQAQQQTPTVSNEQLVAQALGTQEQTTNPVTTAYNPYQLQQGIYNSNPLFTQYITQDASDNLLMMPVRNNIRITA